MSSRIPCIPELISTTRGVAALEFALTGSLLFGIMGGLADFTLAFSARGRLADAVADGATYAFVYYQTHGVTLPTAADVRTVVSNAINLSNVNITVTGPSLKCTRTDGTTNPATVTLINGTAGTACSNGSFPGTYMIVTAAYSYTPMMPFFSKMSATSITQSANVRLY